MQQYHAFFNYNQTIIRFSKYYVVEISEEAILTIAYACYNIVLILNFNQIFTRFPNFHLPEINARTILNMRKLLLVLHRYSALSNYTLNSSRQYACIYELLDAWWWHSSLWVIIYYNIRNDLRYWYNTYLNVIICTFKYSWILICVFDKNY